MNKVIKWWEDELTSKERNKLIPESWNEIGENTPKGIEKRHIRLKKAYQKYHKIKLKKGRKNIIVKFRNSDGSVTKFKATKIIRKPTKISFNFKKKRYKT